MTAPLPPLSRIGILGDGQLGRMLALAAARLGMAVHIFGPDAHGPAHAVAAASTVAGYDDEQALRAFAADIDVATYEFENVPVSAAAQLGRHVRLAPGERALAISQDRLAEKTFIRELGIEVAAFHDIPDADALAGLMAGGFGAGILKTRRLGYDGKGQVRLHGDETVQELRDAHASLAGAPAILEAMVPFVREVSVVAVRGADGAFSAFDPAENVHRDGILATSTVPAAIGAETATAARDIARRIVDALDYVGVIGVEMFVVETAGATRLLVNEIAPRVHNSGHWTMDACITCQFEQHVRAILGWPLGDPARHSDVVMRNLIGQDADAWASLSREPATCIHLYGKRETRAGRKMGHVNVLSKRT
ncbi:MAG: 5-(carboxyamino)imidazole ribonucleotide synthase [Rhodobiaceae bacterium]|nr:5-(carboxyamino)imidazole ribonucleotide synthase [Rhodobiaceae bacterium]MCC0053288.1 5-(carboxyamino)imidazole ribonucleotide synthase [Rhodobiaceae bacterium]